MYMEKNVGRHKSTPVFLPHETFKNFNSVKVPGMKTRRGCFVTFIAIYSLGMP